MTLSGEFQMSGSPDQPQRDTSSSLDDSDSRHPWDINDNVLPPIPEHESYKDWPNGHCKAVYAEQDEEARRHNSGWAMRNTNNHNVNILKKSCLGVFICGRRCRLDNGDVVHMRPAICDKARKKQLGKPCPNPRCDGRLELQPCRGHCGYPVTHFWRHVNGLVFFQGKGVHDHVRPEIKSSAEARRHTYGPGGRSGVRGAAGAAAVAAAGLTTVPATARGAAGRAGWKHKPYERRGRKRAQPCTPSELPSAKVLHIDPTVPENRSQFNATCLCGSYNCRCGARGAAGNLYQTPSGALSSAGMANSEPRPGQTCATSGIDTKTPFLDLGDLNFSPVGREPYTEYFDFGGHGFAGGLEAMPTPAEGGFPFEGLPAHSATELSISLQNLSAACSQFSPSAFLNPSPTRRVSQELASSMTSTAVSMAMTTPMGGDLSPCSQQSNTPHSSSSSTSSSCFHSIDSSNHSLLTLDQSFASSGYSSASTGGMPSPDLQALGSGSGRADLDLTHPGDIFALSEPLMGGHGADPCSLSPGTTSQDLSAFLPSITSFLAEDNSVRGRHCTGSVSPPGTTCLTELRPMGESQAPPHHADLKPVPPQTQHQYPLLTSCLKDGAHDFKLEPFQLDEFSFCNGELFHFPSNSSSALISI